MLSTLDEATLSRDPGPVLPGVLGHGFHLLWGRVSVLLEECLPLVIDWLLELTGVDSIADGSGINLEVA